MSDDDDLGHRKRLKRQLIMAQKGKCFYCQKYVRLGGSNQEHDDYATLDHKWPKSLGGQLNFENAVLACRKCNQTKSNLPEELFWEILAAIKD